MTNLDKFVSKFNLPRNLIKKKGISVEFNDSTYFPDGELQSGWLPALYKGLVKYKEKVRSAKSITLVGIGPGIESFLFLEMFKPRHLLCLDINAAVLPVAEKNILNNLQLNCQLSLKVVKSNLLDYLENNKIKVDLIYENLPNLRISNSDILKSGTRSASFFDETINQKGTITDIYDKSMLRLHHNFLVQAKKCLRPKGRVICCIGARIPIPIIKSMFETLGFTFKILHADLILQLNAEEVIETYKGIEEQRSDQGFLFLPYSKVIRNNIIPAFNECAESSRSVEQLFATLTKFGFTAAEALLKLNDRDKIAHLGLIIEGRLK